MDFLWSEAAQRYRDKATGRFLKAATVNNAVDTVITKAGERMARMTTQLQAGGMTLAEWQVQMAREIKLLQVGAAAVGRGGFAQMSPSDYGWVGQRIRTQYAFLRQFAQDIATGRQPMNGRVVVRAQMYAAAARATQREMMRRTAGIIGRSEEKNVLGAAEHCAGCISASAMGWVPLGTLPPVGARECRSNCRCVIITRSNVQGLAA